MNSILLVLALGNVAVGTGAFVVAGIVGAVAEDLGISVASAGQFLTVYALTYALASPLLASLTGNWPRRRTLVAGMLLVGLGCLASAVAPNAAALFAARVLTAVGGALFAPSASLVAIMTTAPERRGQALSIVFLGQSAAQVLGVPLGTWLAYTVGWRMAFVPVAVVAALAVVAIYRTVPGELRAPPLRLATWLVILRSPALLLAVSLTALMMTALLAPYAFVAPMLTALTGLERAELAPVLWLFGIFGMAGTMGGGLVGDRLGNVRAMAILMLVLILAFAVMRISAGALVPVLCAFVVWATFGYAFMSPQQSRLVTLAPDLQAPLLALNASAIYVGTALGGVMGGITVAHAGALALPQVAAALVAVTLAALWLSVRLSSPVPATTRRA